MKEETSKERDKIEIPVHEFKFFNISMKLWGVDIAFWKNLRLSASKKIFQFVFIKTQILFPQDQYKQ